MNIETLRQYLDDSYAAAVWLCGLGLVDVRRAHGNLLGIATAGVTLDLLAVICDQLERHLPGCADPDMALHNLERFVRGGAKPALHRHAFRARSGSPAHAAANLCHEPIPERSAGHRPGRFRPAAAHRGAAGGPRGPGGRVGGGDRRHGTRYARACGRCGGSNAAKRCASPTATSSASRACGP